MCIARVNKQRIHPISSNMAQGLRLKVCMIPNRNIGWTETHSKKLLVDLVAKGDQLQPLEPVVSYGQAVRTLEVEDGSCIRTKLEDRSLPLTMMQLVD